MRKFINDDYEILARDLIKDAFYVEGRSYRGKISQIRQLTEVIVRKLLDIEPSQKITLGKYDIQQQIKNLDNHSLVLDAIEIINKNGSNYTHTEKRNEVSEEEYSLILDKLFDLLSIFHINYFTKYKFGSDNKIISVFSLLPPIIRYKVLTFLHEKDPQNIAIIDKLTLVILKAFGEQEARAWIEQKKTELIEMPIMSQEVINSLKKEVGAESLAAIQKSSHANMYELCKNKIAEVGAIIKKNGTLYSDFESALLFYKKSGILIGDDPAIHEFNDIMNFLYLGRIEKQQELSCEDNPYLIINYLF